jgi:hexosaminidase
VDGSGDVQGALATLAAPGYSTGAVTATVDWGDGSTSSAVVSGTPATSTSVNGLYSVAATHHYATHGKFAVTVTVTGANTAPATVRLTLHG